MSLVPSSSSRGMLRTLMPRQASAASPSPSLVLYSLSGARRNGTLCQGESIRQHAASSLARWLSMRPPTAPMPFRSISDNSGALHCSRYATSAFANAKPIDLAAPATPTISPSRSNGQNSSERDKGESEHDDPDEPPPKAGIRERLRFLMRRYGWWGFCVYMIASVFDFSATFLAIHLLGADHIRELEARLREYIGMGKREMEDGEVAAWPVPASVDVLGGGTSGKEGALANNSESARLAAKRVHKQQAVDASDVEAPAVKQKKSSGGSSTVWTEAVLAYTIHKTLLLPFRVGITAAVTPSFVKFLVRHGWARDNAAVRQAAARAKAAKAAREAAKQGAASASSKAAK